MKINRKNIQKINVSSLTMVMNSFLNSSHHWWSGSVLKAGRRRCQSSVALVDLAIRIFLDFLWNSHKYGIGSLRKIPADTLCWTRFLKRTIGLKPTSQPFLIIRIKGIVIFICVYILTKYVPLNKYNTILTHY